MHCILYTYLQLPTAMPTCARAHLLGAIGGMIFVARGNTYLSFLLLVDSLNGSKLLDWLGHQSSSLLFFWFLFLRYKLQSEKAS